MKYIAILHYDSCNKYYIIPKDLSIYQTFFIPHITGLLAAVGNLVATANDTFIYLTWTPPFTLDMTFIHPDITYCVKVVNATSSTTLHSQCGITEPEFTYPYTLSTITCDEIKFTVTPVNVVVHGQSQTASYLLCKFSIVVG